MDRAPRQFARRGSAARAVRTMKSSKSLDKSELIASLLLIAMGASVAWEAWDWPYMTKDGPGPGFFPLWIGVLLVVLSVMLLAMQARDAAGGKPAPKTDWTGTGPALLGWGALVAAAARNGSFSSRRWPTTATRNTVPGGARRAREAAD